MRKRMFDAGGAACRLGYASTDRRILSRLWQLEICRPNRKPFCRYARLVWRFGRAVAPDSSPGRPRGGDKSQALARHRREYAALLFRNAPLRVSGSRIPSQNAFVLSIIVQIEHLAPSLESSFARVHSTSYTNFRGPREASRPLGISDRPATNQTVTTVTVPSPGIGIIHDAPTLSIAPAVAPGYPPAVGQPGMNRAQSGCQHACAQTTFG
jgi:hypothetical protein